jgi:hypothetical protein
MQGDAYKCDRCGKVDVARQYNNDDDSSVPNRWIAITFQYSSPHHFCSFDCALKILTVRKHEEENSL